MEKQQQLQQAKQDENFFFFSFFFFLVTKLTGSEVLTKTQIRNFQERASFESKIHKKIQKLPLLRIRIAFDGLKAVKEDLRGELGPLSFCVGWG